MAPSNAVGWQGLVGTWHRSRPVKPGAGLLATTGTQDSGEAWRYNAANSHDAPGRAAPDFGAPARS